MSTTVREFPDYSGKSIFLLASLLIISVCSCSGGGGESTSNTEPDVDPPSPTAELSDLAVTGTTLMPVFDARQTNYYASIDMDQPSATITARTVDSGATIYWPTQTDTAHGVYTVNVEPGETHINIKVIASDSTTEIMYTLNVHRPSADLAHLGVAGQIFSMTPSFDPDVLNYSVSVRLEDASVMISATTVDPWAEIHWPTHIDRQSGTYLVDLVVGENTVKIPVVANEWGHEGIAEKSYTLTLIRAPSSNADLSELALCGNPDTHYTCADIDLNIPFQPDQHQYFAQVDYEIYLTAVNARAEDADAQIQVVNGIRPDEFAEPTWFAVSEGKNLLEVIVTAEDHLTTNTYVVEIDRQFGLGTSQDALLKAFNGESGDRFGVSIAIDGDTLAVGARGEDSNGVTGEADNSAPDAGAVYVFEREGNIWLQQAYLKASNAQADDSFGSSVGLFGDLLVVGAPGEDSVDPANEADNTAESAGAAYVFARSDGIWSQQAYLKASNREAGDKFGYSVAISGSTVAIGACGEDGNSMGDESNNNAEHAGAVYVFSLEVDSWMQQGYLKASNAESYDYFGCQITLDGDTLVASALEEDASAFGGEGDNSETDSGAVYVFYRDVDGWSQQSYLKALDARNGDHFGISTALSADTLAISAPGKDCRDECYETDAGAVYIFGRDGDVWQQHSILSAFNLGRNDNFGSDIKITGNVLVVGAYGEDASATDGPADNSMAYAGAAYIFVHDGEAWKPVDYLKASNADGGDAFGRKVALAGDTLIIAADGEDSAATAGENDNSESESGAVYVYAVGNR